LEFFQANSSDILFHWIFLYPSTQITRSGQRTSEEKLLGIIKIPGILSKLIPRTIRLQWEFFGICPKLVPRTIHSNHTNIPNEKFRLISGMEILLGTNAECTRNFSHGIIPAFYWIFSQVINADLNFSFGFFFKLLRKISDQSYLRGEYTSRVNPRLIVIYF
jgi:hypothetical protein